MNKYWTIILPAALLAVFWFAYNAGSFCGNWMQGLLDPLINVGAWILNLIFGI